MITLIEGVAAHKLLRDAHFREAWSRLHAACPWATVFQGAAFSDAWWKIYADVYSPLLLHTRGAHGELRGLLVLARDERTGTIVPAGSHHAEYHAWLSEPSDGDSFIMEAIAHLRRTSSVKRVRFHFLAPGAPTAWAQRMNAPRAPLVRLSMHPRGLRDIGDGSADRDALRRRSARSKMARLRRNGDVAYLAIEDAAAFERWLPQIVSQSNARHGSTEHPGPFAADPRKADFYRELLGVPGFTHCGVLVRGDQLLASHTGWIDQGALGLGLITFNADEAEHSPGTLLLHLIGADLAGRGVHTFDLTPGGAYKQRFATRSDSVASLDIRLRHIDAAIGFIDRSFRAIARTVVLSFKGWQSRRHQP